MANLIVTIIAIALTAILAIAGAWYGSTAFTEAQAKAEANKILSNFKQVDGAIKVFAVENGGSLPDCASDWPVSCASTASFSTTEFASVLEPRYLQSNTIVQHNIRLSRLPAYNNGFLFVDSLGYVRLTSAVCRQLEGLRTGTAPLSNRVFLTGDSNTINKSVCGQFGCFADRIPGWWSATPGVHIAYFRIAGRPDGVAADCTINP